MYMYEDSACPVGMYLHPHDSTGIYHRQIPGVYDVNKAAKLLLGVLRWQESVSSSYPPFQSIKIPRSINRLHIPLTLPLVIVPGGPVDQGDCRD